MHTHACIILPSFHVCDPYTDQKLLCHYVNRWLSNILYPNRWFYKKKNFFHAAYSVKLMKHSQGPCGLGISKQQRVGESSHPGHFSGSVQFSSVQFSCSVVSDSLQPHGLHHNRPPCPSPTPGACSNTCPSSWWCHPTISSSVIPFSSCLRSFPASGSFPMS